VSVAVDPSGLFAYVSNWGSSNVSAYSINATTGALAAIAGSPYAAGSGPSAIAVDPSGKFVYVANYWSDDVSAFSLNSATGALAELSGSTYAAEDGGHPSSIVVVRIQQ
jgi:6-phosphogluconolactonase (cycloisomerase 2 family)